MITKERVTSSSLIDFIKFKISKVLSIPENAIDMDQSFANYGMDSMSAVVIVGELEEKLKTELPTTLLWDCPTLRELSNYLNQNVLKIHQ